MLYDQFNRPIKSSTPKAPLRRPLAAAPILDSWREYVTIGLTPVKLATIFKEADSGDTTRQAELFDQMEEKDGHLVGERGKRQNVILDVDFSVVPASDDSRDQEVADFIETFFDDRMTDYEDTLVCLQDAVGKGYAGMEIHWDISEGQAVPEKLEFIEQKRFSFIDPNGTVRQVPLLLSDDDTMGAEIPAWKSLFHRYGGKSGHPTRSGIYRVCAWMFLMKNYAVKDWVVFCEVYGMPLRLGKYDAGASQDDKDALIAAISSLGSDAAGIISKNTEIEFVESAKGSVAGDLWKILTEFCNKETSKALLGQTLSADVGDKGSYAAAKTHNDVRLDLVQADSRALAATVRHQLIRPIVGFNFGWDTPVPDYRAVWEEEEDLKEKAEWVTTLLDKGVPMPLSFIREGFNIPEPDGDEPVIGVAPKEAETGKKEEIAKILSKQVAGDGLQDRAEVALTGRLDEEAAGHVLTLLEPIRALVASASTLGEIRDGLLDLYPTMEAGDLGTLMQQAFAAAQLAGMNDVAGGE